jgi:hypothetical protein
MDGKRKQIALLAAVGIFLAVAGSAQQAYAQYGVPGNPTAGATPEQLAECEEYGIARSECTEHTLLAARRVHGLNENLGGSGTPMISIGGDQTWVFVGVLGAIFGGVATAFFVRGRGTAAP